MRERTQGTTLTDVQFSSYPICEWQYVSKLHAEKLRDLIFDKRGGTTQRKKIKMRLASESVSQAITGYAHNAVTPFACKRRIPTIISHHITNLRPDFFWMGAGEVDLKVGLPCTAFVQEFGIHVTDCTY